MHQDKIQCAQHLSLPPSTVREKSLSSAMEANRPVVGGNEHPLSFVQTKRLNSSVDFLQRLLTQVSHSSLYHPVNLSYLKPKSHKSSGWWS